MQWHWQHFKNTKRTLVPLSECGYMQSVQVFYVCTLSGVTEFFETLDSRCGVLHMSCTVSLLSSYMTEALRRLQRGVVSLTLHWCTLWSSQCGADEQRLMLTAVGLPHLSTYKKRLCAKCCLQSALVIMMQYCASSIVWCVCILSGVIIVVVWLTKLC